MSIVLDNGVKLCPFSLLAALNQLYWQRHSTALGTRVTNQTTFIYSTLPSSYTILSVPRSGTTTFWLVCGYVKSNIEDVTYT